MYIYKYHICVRLTSSRCPGWCPGCMHAIYIYISRMVSRMHACNIYIYMYIYIIPFSSVQGPVKNRSMSSHLAIGYKCIHKHGFDLLWHRHVLL